MTPALAHKQAAWWYPDRAEILAAHLEKTFTPNAPNTSNLHVIRHHAAVQDKLERFLSAPTPPLRGEDFISLSELRSVAARLDKRKAPGPDGITNAALMLLPRTGFVALTSLFNGVLRTGVSPPSYAQHFTI